MKLIFYKIAKKVRLIKKWHIYVDRGKYLTFRALVMTYVTPANIPISVAALQSFKCAI